MKRRYYLTMNVWRMGEAEHWYRDMAARGWKLKKSGLWFDRFDKSEPTKALYRIELAEDDEEALKERKEIYGQAGWNWVTGSQRVQIYTAPEGTDEIHTDGPEQAMTLKTLRRISFDYLGRVLTQVIIFLLMVVKWKGLPLTSLWAQGGPVMLLGLGPAYLALLVNGIKGLVTVGRLRKQLQAGIPIDHEADYRKGRIMKHIFWVIGGVCTAVGLVLALLMPLNSYTGPLPETHAPVILMQQLEGEGFARHQDGKNWENDCSLEKKWTPLSVMYHSQERGQDGGWLIQRVMYTDHPEWTGKLVEELLPHYSMSPISEFEVMETTDLDQCLFREKYEGMTEMAAVYEGHVMLLSYWGDEPPEKLAALAMETMKGWRE